MKQVAQAVTALQKYSKAKKQEADQLLADEDDSIHVTFTMQSVPKKTSPKPTMIAIPAPFNSAE